MMEYDDQMDLMRIRRYQEDDFLIYDAGKSGSDHVVHDLRNVLAKVNGGRTAEPEWSNRMVDMEFDMFTAAKCMWQVDPEKRGLSQFCGRDVVDPGRGFSARNCFCGEHAQDAKEMYGGM